MKKYVSDMWKIIFVLLLVNFATSNRRYRGFKNNGKRTLDMDDLMKIHYREPISRKMILPIYRRNDDINTLSYRTIDGSEDDIADTLSKENPIPIKIDFGELGSSNTKENNSQEKNLADAVKDDAPLAMLEELMLHPTWLTRHDQQQHVGKTEQPSEGSRDDNNNSNNSNNNNKRKSDVDRFKQFQDLFKEKLCKGNQCRLSNLWTNFTESEDKSNVNHIGNNVAEVTEASSNVLLEQSTENISNNFEHENQLVVEALNDFYRRLFESLTQAVPSLLFEDPFIGAYESKSRLTNTSSSTAQNTNEKNEIGQIIEKKLENLKKPPSELNRFYEVSLSKILEHLPNLLFMNYPEYSSINREDDQKRMNGKNARYNDNMVDEKTNNVTNRFHSLPASNRDVSSILSYIPQIRYGYGVPASLENVTFSSTQNRTSTKMWYYSNYYTEVTPTDNSTNASIIPSEIETTQAPSFNWPHTNKFKDNSNKNLENLKNLLHQSDMSKRIEWENNYEQQSPVDLVENNNLSQQEFLPSSEEAVYLNNPTSTAYDGVRFHGDQYWLKDPLRGKMMEFILNKGNTGGQSKHAIKGDDYGNVVDKDLTKDNNNYDNQLFNENGKYYVRGNKQSINNHVYSM